MNRKVLIILGLLLMAATAVRAQFNITTNNGTITITGYTGPGGRVTIPTTINNLPVTGIGTSAFASNPNVASVNIPASITNIGLNAFSSCAGLTNIVISDGVTSIGGGSFQNCSGLQALTFPGSVTNIGISAFSKCTNLTGVYFLGNAPTLGSTTFSKDSNAVAYYFPGTIGWTSPTGGLSTVLLPFNYSINPDSNSVSITAYSAYATYFAPVTIPATLFGLPVTRIGSRAFSDSTITTVTIPDTVTSIGDNAFFDCFNLISVTFGSGLTNIGKRAFQGCPKLTSIDLPASVTSIGDEAFEECFRITSIKANPTNSFYSSLNGVLFDKNQTKVVQCPGGMTGNYVIPAGVTSIGNYAFEDCVALTNVTIPASVTNIGLAPFALSLKLSAINVNPGNLFFTSINGVLYDLNQTTLLQFPGGQGGNYAISNNVSSIAEGAFEACQNLGAVTIPSSVTSIGAHAFDSCFNLVNVIIPYSVTNIGSEAFVACSHLPAITVDPSNPYYSSVNGVLFDQNQSMLIQYPGGLGGTYTIPNTVTSIGDGAFDQCSGVSAVTIPGSVTNIGADAFYFCIGLTNITIPTGVISLGNFAFYYCNRLNGIIIPPSVTSIGERTFQHCTGFGNIIIPNSVTNIGSLAFEECLGLTNATIISSSLQIGDLAFAVCQHLSSANFAGNAPQSSGNVFANNYLMSIGFLPGTSNWGSSFSCLPTSMWVPFTYTTNGATISITGYTGPINSPIIPARINGFPVTSIAGFAFDNNNTLTTVTIPNSVTSIGNGTFTFCRNLTDITIPGSVAAVSSLFSACTSLTNVNFSSGVKNIGSHSIDDCNNFVSTSIPASVTNIDQQAFSLCLRLKTITLDAQNLFYTNLDGMILNKNQTKLILYPPGLAGNLKIPDGVTSIGNYAFANSGLGNLTIPGSVTNIGSLGLFEFKNLTNIFFTGNAPAIGSDAFSNDQGAVIYYLPRTTGWFTPFYGLPAQQWNPQAQTGDSSFGVLNNQFGFNITGPTNLALVVEACTNLASAIWSSLQTITLTNGSYYFSDPAPTNLPSRYYRLRSP